MRFFTTIAIIITTSVLTALGTLFVQNWYPAGEKNKPEIKTGDKSENIYSKSNDTDAGKRKTGVAEFSKAAEIATPTVVHIKSFIPQKQQINPYEELLREFYGEKAVPPGTNFPMQQASGSGVILTEDGFIVTNNHVIKDASKMEVVLNDNRSYPAKIIGTDPATDLALVKIEEKGLPFLKFGNSENLKIGTWVIAVGNPFNLNSTVTAGIISAKGRSINIIRSENQMGIESFLQTDAVVNPGNSGGALVNTEGELVGINTAIASPTGAFAGYAFAVPETIVRKIFDDLKKYGLVQRAFLGIAIQDMNAELAKMEGISNAGGVYISLVNNNSAAENANLQKGDVITSIDDIETNSVSKLQEIIATRSPGDTLKIEYLRKDSISQTTAILLNANGTKDLLKSKK